MEELEVEVTILELLFYFLREASKPFYVSVAEETDAANTSAAAVPTLREIVR